MKNIVSYDIDGVIYFGKGYPDGLTPPSNAVIISGRSREEYIETAAMLESRGIKNPLYLNPIPFGQKTRESSGMHKAKTLNSLKEAGWIVEYHIDDDPVQIDVIRKECPWLLVIHFDTPFVEKENVRHEI